MSLQVWLPLNGDLQNLGLDDVTPVLMGAGITYTDGKIGKAATFPNSCSSCIHFPGYKYINNFSWTCWFKCVGQGSGAYQFILSEGRDCGSCGLNLRLNKAGTTMFISFMSTSNSGYTATICNINLNIWYHVAITISKDLQLKVYLNGEQIYTIKIGALDYAQSNDRFVIGKMAYNYTSTSSYFPFNGQVNDVRIYDHCLSPKEVKEISKGLVAHYPLNDGVGNPNLIRNGYGNTIGTTWVAESCTLTAEDDCFKVVSTSANRRIYDNTSNVWNSGETYTVSFFAKSDTNGAVINASRSIADFSPTFTLTTEWKQYSGVINSTTTAATGTLSIRLVTASTVYLKLIKLEKGSIATPWIPNPNDTLYTELGLDDGIVYDCSGYGRNGTIIGDISSKSASPRYSVGMHLNSSNLNDYNDTSTASYIKVPFILTNPDAFTIAVWANINGSYNGGGHGLFATAGKHDKETFNHRDNIVDINSSDGNNHIKPILTLDQNIWTHYVITCDGLTAKAYKNGVQVSSVAFTSKTTLGSMEEFYIGLSTAGGVWRKILGDYSDFRFYATALSDEDIKELYETSASIDSHGNMWAYEIQEV